MRSADLYSVVDEYVWWGGGWQVEVQLQYSQLFCFCLLHVFIPLVRSHYSLSTTLYTCLLDSVVVRALLSSTLRFVHRSGSVTVVNRYFQFPVPWTATFSHSVPGRYRPSWVNLLRFCEFCGFHQSIFFLSFSLPVNCCSGLSVSVSLCVIYVSQSFTLVATGVDNCKKRLCIYFTTNVLCSMILVRYRYTNLIENAHIGISLLHFCTKSAF